MKQPKYKVKEWNFELGKKIYGGFQFYVYQFALGASIRYLDCNASGLFRLYLGPFKIWINLK